MKFPTLEIIVFVSGAVIMVLELVGSRILAPYVGTSIFVWTSLIGIILGSLSLGYFWGGKLADKNASYKTFAMILFCSGLLIAASNLLSASLLPGIRAVLHDIRVGAVLATAILFAPPSILLGMVSPYAVKLKMQSLDQTGSTVGTLYAISTVGSIFGTFLAGFYLLAYLGSTRILFVLAFILLATAVLAYPKGVSKQMMILFIAAPFLIGLRSLAVVYRSNDLIDIDTQYNRIQIFVGTDPDSGKKVRVLRMNDDSSSAMFLKDEELVYAYTRFYRLIAHFYPEVRTCLMLGGGAYSYPRDFLRQFPKARMDVVEIDPALTGLAKQYFKLKEDPRLTIFDEDGRTFLNRTTGRYDVILIDVFRTLYSPPYHLTTSEAVSRVYAVLEKNGVVMANIISSIEGDSGKFLRAEYATYKRFFSQVYLLPVQNPTDGRMVQNVMLVALKSPGTILEQNQNPVLAEYLTHRWKSKIANDVPPLTDDFAPVDHYTTAAVLAAK